MENIKNADETHRNLDVFNSILGLPNNTVYIILNESKKIAYISIPKNPIAWFSRQVQDVKNGMHKCGPIMEWSFIKFILSLSKHALRQRHSDLCKEYVKNGYKVLGAEKASRYKTRVVIKKNKVLLQIVNSRNRVIGAEEFATVPEAKAYAKITSITQLLIDLKV